ncbi:MAG: glycosyltransferase family protein [Vicingaceae bacterium]
MKILYAIQGTGNGHICRAAEIVPHLQKHGELDILVSGIQADLQLPFPVDYAFKGMSFVFGKRGGIDLVNTYMKNHLNRFMTEVKKVPVEKYDLIINDFEPLSAWAAYIKGKPCVGLSNQVAIKTDETAAAVKEDLIGKFILAHYAPTSAEYGFHYEPYAPHIFSPLIRKEVRQLEVSDKGHYTVYLPAYDDQRIIRKLSLLSDVQWEVFSKHSKKEYTHENVHIYPVQHQRFLQSMASSSGVLCAAGFGTTTEALFLKKKLLVIPQKQQYEQVCNALALKKMGVKVIKHLRKKHLPKIQKWIESKEIVEVNYPDQTELIVETIINNEFHAHDNYLDYITSTQFDAAN